MMIELKSIVLYGYNRTVPAGGDHHDDPEADIVIAGNVRSEIAVLNKNNVVHS